MITTNEYDDLEARFKVYFSQLSPCEQQLILDELTIVHDVQLDMEDDYAE